MNIAFVGIEKDWRDLEKRDYTYYFLKHHLELPFYYASYGENRADIVSDFRWGQNTRDGASLEVIEPETFLKRNYDVVVHWRKWFPEHYRPEAVNVVNSQDHSYSRDWITEIGRKAAAGKLAGILCFPGWHENNIKAEFDKQQVPWPNLLPGVTLGVDTQVYQPAKEKRRYDLLWASDPGRGMDKAIELAIKLFQRDKRFKLHICWPDYADGIRYDHPALIYHDNLDNGPELWGLFNECGFLPYTSAFMEPSSRAHRQAQAAGCVVLYPPGMGTPSDLIESGVNGIVEPIDQWVDTICRLAESNEFDVISNGARELAVSEDWSVQAARFNNLMETMIGEKNG